MRSGRPRGVRIAVAIVLAVIVAQLGIVAYAVATADSASEPDAPILPVSEITEPLDLETAAALGQEIAHDWRSDALLVNASMQVDWPDTMVGSLPTELPSGGWAILGYLSGSHLLTLRVDRGSRVVVETEVVELTEADAAGLADREIDFARASTNSTTAILATEAAYGQRYRAACPERRRATWISVLTDESSGEPLWFVRYRDNDVPDRTTLSVRIDWTSGNIQDEVNLDPNCSEEPE